MLVNFFRVGRVLSIDLNYSWESFFFFPLSVSLSHCLSLCVLLNKTIFELFSMNIHLLLFYIQFQLYFSVFFALDFFFKFFCWFFFANFFLEFFFIQIFSIFSFSSFSIRFVFLSLCKYWMLSMYLYDLMAYGDCVFGLCLQ